MAIYKDRVEIYNPGNFPEGYRPEDFISGGERPVRRNPLITSILYYSKDVESFGTGLKRIVDACNEAGCRLEFKILKSGFVVVFYRNEAEYNLGAFNGTTQSDPQLTTQSDPQLTTQSDPQLNIQSKAPTLIQKEMQQKIVEFCATAKSKKEIAEHFGFKDAKGFLKRYVRPLIEDSRLSMTNPDKPNSRSQKYIATK